MKQYENKSGSDSEEEDEKSNSEASDSENESDNESKSGGSDSDSSSEGGSHSEAESGSDKNSASESEKDSGSEKGDDDDDDDDEEEEEVEGDEDNDEAEDEEEDDEDDVANQSDSSSHSAASGKSRKQLKEELKQYWEENPDIYGIRRSARERKQPERMTVEHKAADIKKHRNSGSWHSSESYRSDSDSDEQKSKKKPPSKKVQKQKVVNSDPQEDSDGSGSDDRISRRESRLKSSTISYIERESEDEQDDDDLVEVEWKESKEDENVQMIEKILEHRTGKKGAVGMQTYIYEVEKNGNPNSGFDPSDPEQCETHFLVKWKGWAHVHNTWESEESLRTQKYNAFQVKGFKKLENYLKKEEEYNLLRSRASPEEIEYFEIQAELEKELLSSHVNAERLFAEANENGNKYYYVKWENLPYSEATWELEDLIRDRYPKKIKEYEGRENSTCYPKPSPALKHRPKFSPLKTQPDYLAGDNKDLILRDYQMDGINWLIHAWCKQNSVILADEMGLGKTIQAIVFLSYLFHVHNIYGPFLLVVPLSTLNAWQREFSLWTPDLNVIVYIGDREARRIVRDYEFSYSRTSKRLKFNAVLTTYEILLRDKEELRDTCQWAVLITDEAHRLKNEESQLYQALQEFRTNHRILITGTPLQNSLKELWALLHFIMPDRFNDWESFESQHDTENMKRGFHRLHRQLEPFLLRRVKKDVEKSLPAKVEQILRVDMTSQQKQYYKWILTKNYEMLKKGVKGPASGFINIVMELKKCCNHSFLIKPFDETNQASDYLQLLLRGSGKLLLLDKLLVRLNETGHRVLIFSQMVRMLDILAQYLQLRRFPFQRLDGSIKGEIRRQALDHFNAEGSPDFCFLLSTRAGGLGINLATADTVIIFDSDWNPQNDLQAQARAHRIGQKNQVNIYRLVTKSSIEENIIERAKQKMVLDHLVIQSMDTSGRTILNKKMTTNSTPFNKEELNAILKFGAEELFKDEDEHEEEPVCDIDEILRRAETRDEGSSSTGDDLLSAFKVASLNLDEDEEVSKMEMEQDESNKDWDDIIPQDFREKIAEDEKQKEIADLYLPPRKRKTLNQNEMKDDSPQKQKKRRHDSDSGSVYEEESDEDKPKKRGRPRMYHKDTIKGFTDAEVRRFFRSMKRFSNPLRRIETIGRDADLREKPPADLRRLCETIMDKCRDAMQEYTSHKEEGKLATSEINGQPRQRRDRGPSFKLSGVSINAKSTLATLEDLEPLDKVVPHAPVERASWTLQIKRVKDAHWDVSWGINEDSKLLRGIYEYGMGAWDRLKSDPALSLGEKIFLEGDAKPQGKHLEGRVFYLLKLVKRQLGLSVTRHRQPGRARKIKEPKGISKEIIDNTDSSEDEATNVSVAPPPVVKKPKEKESKEVKEHKHKVKDEKEVKVKEEVPEGEVEKHKKKKKAKKEKKEKQRERLSGPLHITANGEPVPVDVNLKLDQDHPLWVECKEKMRPMKKALKTLDNPSEGQSEEQQLQHTGRCLLQIGDHIEKCLDIYKEPDTRREWKTLLWQFVSQFTEFEEKKLYKCYKKSKKNFEEKKGEIMPKEKHEHSSVSTSEKTPYNNHKRSREDAGSGHFHSPVKRPLTSGTAERSEKWQEKERGRDHDRPDRDRPREDREKNRGHRSHRDWHGNSNVAPRDYKESRYPQEFGNHEGMYHREGYLPSHHQGRSSGDWRVGRPKHHQVTGSYSHPSGSFLPPHHYSSGMYGQSGSHGQHRLPPYLGPSHRGGAEWGGHKERPRPEHQNHDWVPPPNDRPVASYPKDFGSSR